MRNVCFVTGTGTGVGKTVLTALLLEYLRQAGRSALGLKPFCSGTREDARLLHRLQGRDLTLGEVNPYYFDKPVAPLAAAEKGRPPISPGTVLKHVRDMKNRCDVLLIEGSGGLLVPLGTDFMVCDLIKKLGCKTIVVAPNKLGTINHTLLTVKVMQVAGIKDIVIVMMGVKNPDYSSKTNVGMIKKLVPAVPVLEIPYLGVRASSVGSVKRYAKKMKITLAQIFDPVIL